MFLKSIAIQGFKSFANRTSFRFKPGVTAFVGPNGCGKSNVVDAIRWVLGETNARSLRGEIMEDVIFSGSAELKPLGMAEVGITIVNDDALLPIEYSEVNITRRLFRSGESEFLINKNPVRMKDIQELFADTGIGKASYSVMEQGNVDIITIGSSLKFCLVAEGTADIYPRFGPTMEWDTAAGQAIAVYSGCSVKRHDTGEVLTYNKEHLKNPWFVVERVQRG